MDGCSSCKGQTILADKDVETAVTVETAVAGETAVRAVTGVTERRE
jgi:hypothetical protein